MKAITLWQPWAWAICYAGKRIENRTWPPPKALLGKQVAIHAGKHLDEAIASNMAETFPGLWPGRANLKRGAVVAVAKLMGATTASKDPWFFGPVGWQLSDVVVLAQPVVCRGFQGLWDLPPQVARDVEAQCQKA